jgi:hypothetical protein
MTEESAPANSQGLPPSDPGFVKVGWLSEYCIGDDVEETGHVLI